MVRVDFNVPIKKGIILDDLRIRAGLATIRYLVKRKAKVFIVTHLGRPHGTVVSDFTLAPVARHAAKLLGQPITFFNAAVTANFVLLKTKLEKIGDGEVAMLENIRFSPDEDKNTGTLAQDLAAIADLYVLDGFAVAHRSAASVSGVAKFLPAFAGFLLGQEITGLSRAMEKPKRPLVAIVGGAKAETKIPVVKNLLPKADYILVSGGFYNTYLWAKGFAVGNSLIQPEFKKEVLQFAKNKKLIFPVDVVVGAVDGSGAEIVPIDANFAIKNKSLAIFDIGPATVQLFSEYIKKAKTLIWNGAMGRFEVHPYEYGTYALTHLFAARSKGRAFGVVGGGETVQVFEKLGLAEDVDLVSTGGGAMLEFLGGKKLPGLIGITK